MIKLFDWLSNASLDLEYSLEQAGFTGKTIVINDDGNIGPQRTSPYVFFCGMENQTGTGLYFNKVPLPDFWQITGTNASGEIWNRNIKMGEIFYHEPTHLRIVKQVDWFDREHRVRYSDHYNLAGFKVAKSFRDEKNRIVLKKYYSLDGQEIISENYLSGNILLNWNEKTYIFSKKVDFVQFYLKESNQDTSQIFYNTLSSSFIVSHYFDQPGDDILFWQEKITDTIPGNMRLILEQKTRRSKRVVVQDQESYKNMLKLLPQEQAERVSYLGYIYPEKRQNQNGKEILILTNSDNIQDLSTLVISLPTHKFHIAALTEMSPRLTSFAAYENVTLYPNVSNQVVEKLVAQCDIYLDINHGREILSANRMAFEHNLLILAFENTVHQPMFMASEHLFAEGQGQEMVDYIANADYLPDLVRLQRQKSGQDSKEQYIAVLKKGDCHDKT
ncbi:accessory Sec system glycosylation chaperone GtfB [Streptococcus cameli]